MKILSIIGTPTKDAGYTVRTVRELERSLGKIADVEMEYLYLEDVSLPRCQGHLTCIKFGEQQCPFGSSVASIQSSMEAADAVVFASPVHCFNVSTLMKNFIDLFVFQMHRPSFFGKKALVVATAAGAGQKSVLKYLRKIVASWGFEVVGQLGSHAGLFDEPKYQLKLIRAADSVAAKLVAAVAKGDTPNPGLVELISFRVWRSVVVRSRDESPFDWNYWQESGWLEQDYYFPVKANAFSNGLAAMVEKMIGRAIRKVSVNPVT